MSHKQIREEGKINASKNLAVVSKCLAIVLIPKNRKNSSGDILENEEADETVVDPVDGNIIQSSEVRKGLSPAGYSGKELLQDFKIRNKTCYWNPSLVESIKSLECKGFVEPSTILVTGADIHLENLRSAWARRVLKAPAGFVIERIGDVSGIEMQVIPQTHFIPLPDALCSIIMDLNMHRVVATLETIWEKLTAWYKDMTVPPQQLVFDTLASLIRDRKVFHTGSGYFVVTPDTNRLQNSLNSGYLPTNASWLPYHPMYVPVFQGQQSLLLPTSRAHMRSISCQVTTIEESSEEEDAKDRKKDQDRPPKTSSNAKSDSLKRRDGKNDAKTSKVVKRDIKPSVDDSVDFRRSSSLRVKGEKAQVPVLNLKPKNVNQEKEKGEKASIFSRLFSRKKKHKDKDKVLMPPPPPPPPPPTTRLPTTASICETGSEGKGDKEYGTFSAQFPPPEWVWYHQQLEKQKRTETWITQQTSKGTNPQQPSKVTSRPPSGVKHSASCDQITGTSVKLAYPSHIDYLPMRAASVQKDKITNGEVTKQIFDGEFVKPQPIKPDNFYEIYRNPSTAKHRQHQRKSRDFERADEDRKHQQTPSEYAVIDEGDITRFHDSNVYNSVSALSPVAHLNDESTYAKLTEQPKLGPLHSTPRYEGQTDRTAYRVEGHESRDRMYEPLDHSQKRKSHRTRRRPHRTYSYYSGHGDDISYEYKGRLPNKNCSQAQSRDSGVNCAGLVKAEEEDERVLGGPNKPPTKHPQQGTHHQHKHLHQPHSSGNHVHFDTNNTVTNESISPMYVTDYATNSLVYQSDVTNPAYNSVVYGSSVTDQIGGPSVVYHTITESALGTSELRFPHNSLQSVFYSEGGYDFTSSNVMCKVDINSKACEDVVELHDSPDTVIVDVLGSSTDGEQAESATKLGARNDLEVAFNDRPKSVNSIRDISCDEKLMKVSDTDQFGSSKETEDAQECVQCYQAGSSGDGKSSEGLYSPSGDAAIEQQQNMGNDNLVSDSGFCSPRNPENPTDRRELPSNQSNSTSENSDGLSNQDNSSYQNSHPNTSTGNTPQSSSNGSSDHHSNSDVYMATGSEHHSGSTNENGDFTNGIIQEPDCPKETNSQKPLVKVKHSSSLNSVRSHTQQTQPSTQLNFQPPHQHCQHHQNLIHLYQPTAKTVPHPDIYNNNMGGIIYIEQNRPGGMPIYAHPVSQPKPQHKHQNKRERPRSVDLWKSNTPSDLHKFEEEQLSKKYGANGEFEVMGVL